MKCRFLKIITIGLFLAFTYGCSSGDDGGSTTTTTETTPNGSDSYSVVLSGSVSATSVGNSSSSANAHLRSSIVGTPTKSVSDSLSGCSATAYDAKTDDSVATADVVNGSYEFKENQLDLGTTYKVVVDCVYNGSDVKLSSYGTSVASTDATLDSVDIDPKSTAVAAYVKKALVKAVVKALTLNSGEGTTTEKREKALELIGPLVTSITDAIQEKIDTGSMEFPDDPSKVSALEEAVAALALSEISSSSATTQIDTAFDSAQNADDWEIPPTLDGELDGAASQGAANMACQPWTNTPATEADQISAIKDCARTLSEFFVLGLKWTIAIENGTANDYAFWGVTTCDSTGFGMDDSLVQYMDNTDNAEIPAGICVMSSRLLGENRNGDMKHEDNMVLKDEFLFTVARNMKLGTAYTLQDIDNMLFKKSGTGDNQIGWGANIIADLGSGQMYAYDITNGFQPITMSGCGPEGCDSIDFPVVTSPTNVIQNMYVGDVPDKDELEDYIRNTKTFVGENTFQVENYVLISESPSRGKEANGDSNYCEDNDPSTTCTTASGADIDDVKITVGITFSKLASGDVGTNTERIGFRYISGVGDAFSTQSKNEKNFYLEPIWSDNGATGAFALVNATTGYRYHNPWGYEVGIVIVRSEAWCNDSTSRFGDLGCDGQTGKAVELWIRWDSDGGREYITPKTTADYISVAGDLVSQLDAAKVYNFRRGNGVEYTFKCTNNPYDNCEGGATDEYPTHMNPLAYGDWNSLTNIKFSLTESVSGVDVSVDSSGEYYAEEEWSCTNEGVCSQTFYFFKAASGTSDELELYRTDSTADLSDTRFGVRAFRITDAQMDTAIQAAGLEQAVDYFYFQGPVVNPSWSAEKDPWNLTGANDSTVTFSNTWTMREWLMKPLWNDDLSASDFTARCSYFVDTTPDTYSYQTLCNSISAISSLREAIENMRWNAIDWDMFTGSGDGPFTPVGETDRTLQNKWDAMNYAQQALWNWDLTAEQREERCTYFSDSVEVGGTTTDLQSACQSAVASSSAPENFFDAMETKCWGQWDPDTDTHTPPTLGPEGCLNSTIVTAFQTAQSEGGSVSLDTNGDDIIETYESWDMWWVMNIGTEAVWNRSLTTDERNSRCAVFSDSTANQDPSFKSLCETAVSSDGSAKTFMETMTNLTDGPFVDWTKVETVDTSNDWEKRYQLIPESGSPITTYEDWGGQTREFMWKGDVSQYLEQVMWNHYNENWNPNGLQADDITVRCYFFISSLQDYCNNMAIAITAKSTFEDLMMSSHDEYPTFIDWDDSRIIRKSDNGYLYNDPDAALNLYSFSFPESTFNGSAIWTTSTEFNALQVFSLIFNYFEPRSRQPLDTDNIVWGELSGLSDNQKSWLEYETFSEVMMTGSDYVIFKTLGNALNNPAALR